MVKVITPFEARQKAAMPSNTVQSVMIYLYAETPPHRASGGKVDGFTVKSCEGFAFVSRE